jgi:uncharacterized protein YdeI (BOF family)
MKTQTLPGYWLALGLLIAAPSTLAADYEWNTVAPVKIPAPANANGKTVLFDVSHGGTEGNADWVIDGGFSDFADSLVNAGYRVEEYRGVDLNSDGIIRYYDDLNTPANSSLNEAIITYAAIQHADVLVLAESNRPFKTSEYQALEQFVAAGKGIYFIADHYNADRNLNTWDATEVFNGYNRSNLAKYNIGGEYGDLRNPGAASGWLEQNFGIRFRFNAIDCKTGVSDITAPIHAEGITTNVDAILMAGGATLAITDPSKAKGLVYLSSQDNASRWSNAVDAGLYFGGRNEGPYVAIAKAGAGKAAFIGDSSPVEDASPKYRRQDTGNSKTTYPGWTDPGHASTLSINIVNWLATPESYTAFDNNNGHTAGEATPTPVATTELTDPDNGNPWSTPSGSYNPWDSATFANGSYGARLAVGGGTTTPPPAGTISVTDALALPNGTVVTLQGIVTSSLNGIYALVLTDAADPATSINIKLESSQRNNFSPDLNPAIINHTLTITGTRNNYLSAPGVTSVSSIVDNGIVTTPVGTLSVTDALTLSNGTEVELEGIVSASLNGIYALVLTDSADPTTSINIKLESSQRNNFSPELNPAILNHSLTITGTRNDYLSAAGVTGVTSIVDNGIPNDPGQDGNSYVSVADALNATTGTPLVVTGYVIQEVNGIYGLQLQDINDSSKNINVKLESQYRNQFNPQLNPSIVGQQIYVSGQRDAYMSAPGIRYVDDMGIVN